MYEGVTELIIFTAVLAVLLLISRMLKLRWGIIYTHIVEVLTLGFIIAAAIFITGQSDVTDAQQKKSADESAEKMEDKLNDPNYLNKFDDSTSVDTLGVKADSTAKK